jgi:hypothetical protein
VTLEELHEVELSLMRTAFENACGIAGLPLAPNDVTESNAYAQIATAVQTLVERGIADPVVVASFAAASCGKADSNFNERFQSLSY